MVSEMETWCSDCKEKFSVDHMTENYGTNRVLCLECENLENDECEMEIQHTANCLAAREKERVELTAYEKEYPNYCRICDGSASHPNYEYCPKCMGLGKCPRCGSNNNNFVEHTPLGSEKSTCFSCGWKEGDPGAPEVVNDFDCGCYNDEADANESARLLSGGY